MAKSEVLHKETMDLPHKLDQDEVRMRGTDLAVATGEMENHIAHEKQVKAELNATKKAIEARMLKLAGVVRDRSELRATEVHHVAFWEEGVVRIVRPDTGETVRARPLTQAERQRDLEQPDPQEKLPGTDEPEGGGTVN